MASSPETAALLEWSAYVGAALATIVSAFVAKMALRKPPKERAPESYTQVAGALVDGSAILKLADTVDSFHAALAKEHRRAGPADEERNELMRQMVKAIESLSENVAHTNVLTERGEEDRVRREHDRLREENIRLQRTIDEANRRITESGRPRG